MAEIENLYEKWALEEVGNAFNANETWRADIVKGFVTYCLNQYKEQTRQELIEFFCSCCKSKECGCDNLVCDNCNYINSVLGQKEDKTQGDEE